MRRAAEFVGVNGAATDVVLYADAAVEFRAPLHKIVHIAYLTGMNSDMAH